MNRSTHQASTWWTFFSVALGYARNRDFIEMDELPPEFQELLPEQVEDILCIFKDDLARFRAHRG